MSNNGSVQPAAGGSKELIHNFVFASNEERLNWQQWLVVAAIMALIMIFGPAFWEHHEGFAPTADYRVPAALGNDYWHYRTWTSRAVHARQVLMLGDSVVWGEYARPEETLTAQLNRCLGEGVFANAGLGGAHPAALFGLVRHYGGDIRGRKVILQWNPLWMSSMDTDLRRAAAGGSDTDAEETEALRINHPSLLPQFDRRINGYDAGLEERLGVAIEHHVRLLQLMGHIRAVCFGGMDLQHWCIANPLANPLAQLSRPPPAMEQEANSRPAPWQERGLKQQDYRWVAPGESVQWRAFRRLVGLLRHRGNDLLVIVGPINRHMMTESAATAYAALEQTCRDWLKTEGIPAVCPPLLPSEQYCDASHPSGEGYRWEAEQLLADPIFSGWLGRPSRSRQ